MGARDSGDKGSDDQQDQAAGERKYDFAYVHEAWKAREGKAAVDEASPETTPLELRKDRNIIFGLSTTVKKYFAMLKGMRRETEDNMYQAATAIAFALGYTKDHISIRSKYEFLEDMASQLAVYSSSYYYYMASMLERQHVSPSVIDELLKAKRLSGKASTPSTTTCTPYNISSTPT